MKDVIDQAYEQGINLGYDYAIKFVEESYEDWEKFTMHCKSGQGVPFHVKLLEEIREMKSECLSELEE